MWLRFRLRKSRRTVLRVLMLLAVGCGGSACAVADSEAIAAKGSSEHQQRQAARSGTILLDSRLTILVRAGTSEPIQKAAEDLASDFQKVLGNRPKIINREEESGSMTILIAEQSKLPESMRRVGLNDPESFSISTASADWNKARRTEVVLLTGADMRGTIYAIYEFARKFLGIDPLYYWTDHEPLR